MPVAMKNKPQNPADQPQPLDDTTTPINPADMSVLQLIARCGALRYSLTQIVALLRPRLSRDDINALVMALRTPGSPEYETYETGMTTADFQLQSRLLDGAAADKDAYDAYSSEQRRQAVNAALADKFGIAGPGKQ